MSLDERWIRSLHVEAMRHADLHADHEPHVLFQASTIGALLEGSYEGDVSFARARRARRPRAGHRQPPGRRDDRARRSLLPRRRRGPDRRARRLGAHARSPSSSPSRPVIEFDLEGSLDHDRLLAEIDRRIPAEHRHLRRPDRRPLRAGPGAVGAAPGAALPAAHRGGGRAEGVRAHRRRRDDARLPLPRLRRGNRGERLAPPLHQRGPLAAAGTCSTSRSSRCCTYSSIHPASLHVELPPGSGPRRSRTHAGSTHDAIDRVGALRLESGRPDLNRGPLPPKGSALPGCATPRASESRVSPPWQRYFPFRRSTTTSAGSGRSPTSSLLRTT